MKELIFLHPKYGDISVLEGEVVKEEGEFQGLSQRELFDQIMISGYEGRIPAIFIGETYDGQIIKKQGDEARYFIDNPEIKEVTIMAPMAGG